jgi:tetratricopeptide (TPR) repeat protein
LALTVFFAVVGLAVWAVAKGKTELQRLLGFGLGFFLVTILLVLQFIPVGAAMMADRYSYLSYFGLIFLVVYGVGYATRGKRKDRRLVTVGLAGFAVLCFYLTAQQVRVWKNSETLWANALRYYRDYDLIHEALGIHYAKNNRADETIEHCGVAVRGGTPRYGCYEGLGNAYRAKHEYRRALEMYARALQIDPTRGEIYFNRGLTLHETGRRKEAIEDFSKALELAPNRDPMILRVRGLAFLQDKQYERALEDYDRFLRLRPDDPEAWHNRGVSRLYLGDRPGAVADLRRALALKPDFEEAKRNLRQLEQVKP